jgi:hypothetical protein
MKVKINSKEREFPPGTRLIDVVVLVREANKDDPVTKSLLEKTGRDHITYIVNRRIIKPEEYNKIDLKDGDEIRWSHPYAGG